MKWYFRTWAFVFLVPSLLLGDYTPRLGFDFSRLRAIAIQDRGRVKPLDTFATDSVLTLTGRRQWLGRSSTEILFAWLVTYESDWHRAKFIKVDHGPLKTLLGLPVGEKYFSPEELRASAALRSLLREVDAKARRKERLETVEKKAQHLQEQIALLDAIVAGEVMTVLPNPQSDGAAWFPLSSMAQSTPLPYEAAAQERLGNSVKAMITAFAENNAAAWNENVGAFCDLVTTSLAPSVYPTASSLRVELTYNNVRPFRLAWVLYALAFVLLLAAIFSPKAWLRYSGVGVLGIAFLVHAAGFVLRSMVSGRPPVTNMYESVIWVSFGCVFFAFAIWFRYRNLAILAAASVFSIAGLVLADNLPFALDPSIHPLEPVLRSNFWLTIHVLTITLSYAAFGLSLCLGNVVMGNYLLRRQEVATVQTYSLYMYRSVQIGVVLLAAGTILGGVWADYSWGRFWGWDPKEVWALIALLLYLAVLHGRFAGWLRGFGFAATTIVSFLGVLMAWYGVNFVLGVGLHSYGFGTGGMGWVTLYVGLQVGFILLAYRRHLSGKKAGEPSAPAVITKP